MKAEPIKLPYNEASLKQVEVSLRAANSEGQTPFYEVLVDGLPVIPKTNDPSRFDSLDEMVNETSRIVKIKVYYGGSRSNREFRLQVNNEPAAEEKISQAVNQALSQRETQEKIHSLKKKKRKLKKERNAMREYIEKLHAKIKVLEEDKTTLRGINLGEVAGHALEDVIRRNPTWLEHLPMGVGAALSGFIKKENQQLPPATDPAPQQQGQFQRADAQVPALDDLDKYTLGILQPWKTRVQVQQIQIILYTADLLTQHPHFIPVVQANLEKGIEKLSRRTEENVQQSQSETSNSSYTETKEGKQI